MKSINFSHFFGQFQSYYFRNLMNSFHIIESSQDYNQKNKIPIAPVVSEEIIKMWKINDEDEQHIADT